MTRVNIATTLLKLNSPRQKAPAALDKSANDTKSVKPKSDPQLVALPVSVPNRYRHECGMAELPAKLLRECEAGMHQRGETIFLSGVTGCGKSYLAAYLMKYAIACGLVDTHQSVWVDESDFLKHSRDAIKGSNYLPNLYNACDLLVFDDLASTRLTEWGTGIIAELLCNRFKRDRKTVVTSNLEIEEIAEKIDGRVASRLCESGLVFVLPPVDLRVRKGAAK